ncbi:hypothetical protein HLH34_01300 [Gluconacetobacter azotocaptans]|uniref:Uncharacterized protein n=1 Tax=Gluconacetobacter azotocaptans TaxID=142834 RepID=A0A7W4JPN5_9PROT|nr:hypothetical protein [Gluconacetobacter azotocaptans]MBB2188599.1 hypothetical protein [Gluconacetobacter azotocaptans]MBM9400303.1 hypothetical protein [Gluconacetobacter azotocaptans]
MSEPSKQDVAAPICSPTTQVDGLRPARGLVRAVVIGVGLWILIILGFVIF